MSATGLAGWRHKQLAVALPPSKGPWRTRATAVRIRCTRCGYSERVQRSQAHERILYHRDITCPEKLAPSTRPRSKPRDRKAISLQRIERPKRHFCPTCREELARVRDAWACTTGCTNLA